MRNSTKRKFIAVFLSLALMVTMMPMTAFAGEASNLEWYNFRNNPENNGVVDKATPSDADTAGLKWAEKFGSFIATPTPPLILDGYLYVGMQKKVYKIDKTTGKKVAESDEMVASVGYAMNPLTYADGKIFVQVGKGMIQAVDYETLKCVWHTEQIGGQTVCPISYTRINGKGYLYSGTWSSASGDGALLCISTDDSNVNENKIKKTEWRFIPSGDESSIKNKVYDDTPTTYDEDIMKAIADGTAQKRGFYWTGAYACDKFIAVGSDDGANDLGEMHDSACFYILDPVTGKIIDKIAGIKGDIRTSIVYDDGFMYFCTKGGLLYKVAVDENGNIGDIKTLDMGGEITSSPVVYNGRVYIGVKGPGGQLDPDGGHVFAVVDSDAMTRLYDLPIKGYPQASALLSTAYENKDFDGDGKADGRVYIYFTYNAKPGGIYYTYDAKNQENAAAESGELFIPDTDMQQYCISTICTDNDGVLYYKNDSGYIMAVENKVAYVSKMEFSDLISWNREFTPGITSYEVVLPAGTRSTTLKMALPVGVSAMVNGEAYDESKGAKIELDNSGKASVKISVTKLNNGKTVKSGESGDNYTTEYNVNIRCQGTDSTLKSLAVSGSNMFGEDKYALSPAFSGEKTQYTVDLRKNDRKFYNIWPEISDPNGSFKVYAVENVAPNEINDDGTIKLASSIEGNDRYAVYPKDKSKNTKVRIEVTSENGKEITEYTVTLLKENKKVSENGNNPADGGQSAGSDGSDKYANKSETSKTGDQTDLTFYLVILAAACAAGLVTCLKREKSK